MSITRIRFAALAALLVACQFNFAAAASFDCAKAQTPIERSICSSPELSKLDSSLALAYQSALTRSAAPDQLRAEQRTWLRDIRNQCTSPVCLTDTYQRRIAALSPGAAPSVAAPSTPVPSASAPVEEVPIADVSESDTDLCDRLAAHPDDPEAVAQGVSDEQLIAGRAATACENAIKEKPELPRLHFQLARNYLAGDRIEDGVEQLILAAEAGHGAALAFLGDLNLSGAPGIEADPVLAHTLYENAVASGFEPAKKILAEFIDKTAEYGEPEKPDGFFARIKFWVQGIFSSLYNSIATLWPGSGPGPGTESVGVSESAPESKNGLISTLGDFFSFESTETRELAEAAARAPYINADIMDNIYNRKFDAIPHGETWTKGYLINVAEIIQGVCEDQFSVDDIEKLVASAEERVFPQSTIDLPRNPLSSGTLQVFNEATRDPLLLLKLAVEIEAREERKFNQSTEDAEVLLERFKCQSKGLKKFSKNLTAYVQNEDAPIAAPGFLMETCLKAKPNPQYEKIYCFCFERTAHTASMSQVERKILLKNFSEASPKIKRNKIEEFSFGSCLASFVN